MTGFSRSELPDQEIQLHVEAAADSSLRVAIWSFYVLGEHGEDPRVQEAWLHLCQHRLAEVRFRSLGFLRTGDNYCFPEEFVRQIAIDALSDRSGKVREIAAELLLKYGGPGSREALDAAVHREKNEKIRETLKECAGLLRDEYYVVYAHGDEVFDVSICVRDSRDRGSSVVTEVLGKDEYSEDALAALVNEERRLSEVALQLYSSSQR